MELVNHASELRGAALCQLIVLPQSIPTIVVSSIP